MSSCCKGLCIRDKSPQIILGYDQGQKFCTICNHRFITEDYRCMCCKQKMRGSAKYNRNSESKSKLFQK